MYYSKRDYKLVKFQKSTSKFKKYDAILKHRLHKNYVRVPFGDNRYEQYKDRTKLGIYSHLDHLDKKRKKLYHARHQKDKNLPYSPSYFSSTYLW